MIPISEISEKNKSNERERAAEKVREGSPRNSIVLDELERD